MRIVYYHMIAKPDVVVAGPVCRRTAFALQKFLSNQRDVQQCYPGIQLVLATNEADFIEELNGLINNYQLKGKVIFYTTERPSYFRDIAQWNITCGREAIRRWFLTESSADYLLFCDADMTYEASVVDILLQEIKGHDVVQSCYFDRTYNCLCLEGFGCAMLTRDVMHKAKFRCIELKNGRSITQDLLYYIDLARAGAKIKRGFFTDISHYRNPNECATITRQPLSLRYKITLYPFLFGYSLHALSIIFKAYAGILHSYRPGSTKS